MKINQLAGGILVGAALLSTTLIAGASPPAQGNPTPTTDPNVEMVEQVMADLAESHYQMGMAFYQGLDGSAPDYPTAYMWFTRAAEQGSALGMFAAGFMCENGQGVPVDVNQAIDWYTQAANLGLADAQNALGSLYFWGTKVPQDYDEAERWLTPAGHQNHVAAQYTLGLTLTMRTQDPRLKRNTDLLNAFLWLRLAEINGQDVSQAIVIPQTQLTPDEQAQAEPQIREILLELDNEGLSALYKAAGRGEAATVERLLGYGMDANLVNPANGYSTLVLPAAYGYADVVDVLLAEGADPNARGFDGVTPLHVAATVQIATALLDHGASVNAVDSEGNTPLQWALHQGRQEVADVLVAHGAIEGAAVSAVVVTATPASAEASTLAPTASPIAASTPTPAPPTPTPPVADEPLSNGAVQFTRITWLGPCPGGQVLWSADGATLAVAQYDGIALYDAVRLDAAPRLLSARLPWGHNVLAITSDGQYLAAATDDMQPWLSALQTPTPAPGTFPPGGVMVWQLSSGQLVGGLEGYPAKVRSIAISPDNSSMATASDDYTVRLWDAGTKEMRWQASTENRVPTNVVVSPDGSLVAATTGGGLLVWETATGALVQSVDAFVMGNAAFSPDGRTLAAGTHDGVARWEVPGFAALSVLEDGDPAAFTEGIAFSPDGALIAGGMSNGMVLVWDGASGQRVAALEAAPGFRAYCVAFSPDGSRLASHNADGTVTVWTTETSGAEQAGLSLAPITLENAAALEIVDRPQLTNVRTIAWDPAYPMLLLIATFTQYHVWGPQALVDEINLPDGLPGGTDLLFSRDGSKLVLGGYTIALIDLQTGERLWETNLNTAAGLALHPGARMLAATVSVDAGLAVQVWDLGNGEPMHELGCGAFDSQDLDFSPAGELLVCGGFGTNASVWDPASGEMVVELARPPQAAGGSTLSSLDAATFSPDGKLLAGGMTYMPYFLVLWDTSTWQPTQVIPEESAVKAIAFSPDGSLLAALTDAGRVEVWGVETGQHITWFDAPAGSFRDLAFSPDGRLLAVSGDTLELWGVTP